MTCGNVRTYIHLSDLHFGQESGSTVHVHRDIRNRLIDDARELARADARPIDGVIVTGDVANAGKKAQYDEAARWLDCLCAAVGCRKIDVVVVPGNHDVDRESITGGCQVLLDSTLADDGEEKLEDYLNCAEERGLLYRRFSDYRDFAAGYGCTLDTETGYACDRSVRIADRTLRFIGFNSALICGARDVGGGLLLGIRQRALPLASGEELVVLCHHPLESLRDSDDTARFLNARARVFACGHTHNPSHEVVPGKSGEVLYLSAGAAVPPNSDSGHGYTYNRLTFECDGGIMTVGAAARKWDHNATVFVEDAAKTFRVTLANENAHRAPTGGSQADLEPLATEETESVVHAGVEPNMADDLRLIRLRFFRDLTRDQRIAVLVNVGVLADLDWPPGALSHTLQRQLLERVLSSADGVAQLDSGMKAVGRG